MIKQKKGQLFVFSLFVILCFLFLPNNPPAFAKTYTIGTASNDCYDTSLWSGSPTSNFGSSTSNFVGFNDSNTAWMIMRSLYRFDLTTLTDNNETSIVSASLRLYLTESNGTNDCTITAHRLIQPWTENGATWDTTDGSSSWTRVGGSWDTTEASTAVGVFSGAGFWNSWDLTDLTQYWLNNPLLNYGVLLKGVNESGNILTRYFVSHNVTPDNSVYIFRPQLVVRTPPVTTLSTNPGSPNGQNDWFVTTPNITLTRNDSGTTYYQWDTSGLSSTETTVTSFSGQEGQHTLYYYSVDTSSTTESVKNRSFKVDTVNPTASIIQPATGTYISGSIDVTGTASDDNLLWYVVDYGLDPSPASWTTIATGTSSTTGLLANWDTALVPERAYSLRLRVQDQAGNLSIDTHYPVNVDNTTPTVSSTDPPNGQQDFPINTSINATFSETVNASSVNTGSFYLKDQGGTTITATVSLNPLNTITWLAPSSILSYATTYTAYMTPGITDLAGHALETTNTFSFKTIASPDGEGPHTYISCPITGQKYRGMLLTTATVTDASTGNSSVAAANFAVDDINTFYPGTASDGSFDSTVEAVQGNVTTTAYADGPHTIYWRGRDSKGNWGNWDSTQTVFDNTPPISVVGTVPSSFNGQNGWFITKPTVTISRDEPGITWMQWAETTPTYTDPSWVASETTQASEGTHTLYFYSTDTMNNTETVKSQIFKVDTQLPTDPSTISSSSHTVGVWSNDRTIDITWTGDANDVNSGIDGYSVSWSQNTSQTPDESKDLEEMVTSTSSLSLADGAWWFNLRTVDNAGNWTSTKHLGPFRLDTSLPSVNISSGPTGTITTNTASFTWTGSDSGSADLRYSYYLQGKDTTYSAWSSTTQTTYSGLSNNSTYALLVRARDGAGNVSLLPAVRTFSVYVPIYYFPWYDCQGMKTWILVGNPNTSAASVTVKIGGTVYVNSESIPAGDRRYYIYPGVMNGPVEVKSDKPVFTTQRSIYQTSFSEVAGLKDAELTSTYYFPWYDGQGMRTWILVGNPNLTPVTVDVKVGGTSLASGYNINGGGRAYFIQDGLMNGPVKVTSSGGNVYTTQRSLYQSSFCEVPGIPASSLASTYYFPWYDGQGMRTWVLVGNPNLTPVTVDVKVGGTSLASGYNINGGGRAYFIQDGLMNGPVKVTSSGGNVYTTQRSLYQSSFCEVPGIPASSLASTYYFPWYDGQSMQTWVLVGNSSTTQTAYVSLAIGPQTMVSSYAISPGSRQYFKYDGLMNGPVKVTSTGGSIYTTERSLYLTSFWEIAGIKVP